MKRETPIQIAPPGEIPVARLAASQLRRMRRVVDAAVTLAEQGGYDGMRLRDVAEASDVALGTLYKYFRSKEDILLFAVTEEVEKLEAVMATRPIAGATPVERGTRFFSFATKALVRREGFARAGLRAVVSGDPAATAKVAGFHLRMTRMILAALRGTLVDIRIPPSETAGGGRSESLAFVLQQVWFASLVGWSVGLHSARTATEQVERAMQLMLPHLEEI